MNVDPIWQDFMDLYNISNIYNLSFSVLNSNLFLIGTINDSDGDGINNSLDNVVGNKSNLDNNFADLNISINNSSNLSQIFNSTLNVSFKDGEVVYVDFVNNFSGFE